MKSTYRTFLAITVFICIVALIILIIGVFSDEKENPFGIICSIAGLGCLIGLFGFWFMQSYLIFKGINQIQSVSEETVTIRCKKISLITQPVSKHSHKTVCIVLTDWNGNKYYYITDRYFNYTADAAREKITTDFPDAKLSLRCYTGTNYVKFDPEINKEPL